MNLIWTKEGSFRRVEYASEADLEESILQVQSQLFGSNRIYLDIKKKIGEKGGTRNIPDGYLIDLSGRKPRLYVVEVELKAHDPLRHIAVQILQFSLSFESEPRLVIQVLLEALQKQPNVRTQCEQYVEKNEFRNLDHMLDYLVHEAPFAALVIIDEMPDNLQNVLLRKFQFGVEVLELTRYEDDHCNRLYHFEPFLADISEDVIPEPAGDNSRVSRMDVSDVDTVVVPAREDGFQDVFIRENRWYAVRIHGTMRPQIKFIAAYRVAPISAITHLASVKSIEPWKETNKFVVNFSEPAHEVGPIQLVKGGQVKALQNLRYTTRERLETAKTLDDVW